MTGARRARPGWLRKNTAALCAVVVAVPFAGWWVTREDYKAWYDAEPRDPVRVEPAGTTYAEATWYPADVEVDPRPVRATDRPEQPPAGTTRVRVHLRLMVQETAKLESLGGCRIHLRAPDGRIWDQSALEDDFIDRPTGCTGGSDDKPQSWRRPGTAQFHLKPQAGKPFETVAVFVVPADVAQTAEPIITWATRLPTYLEFPR